MTSASLTNFGHFTLMANEPDAGPAMTGGIFVNQTNFLGVSQ
jgi:hypothetical protein